MSIGERMRQLRKANKLSGDKFGELCGVTKGTVSQWESGLTTPLLDRLIELHKHLDFSFDWLLNGDDDDGIYRTSDPTLVQILKALEPRGTYDKAAAHKAVISTIDIIDHAATKTYRPTDRRHGLHFYGGPERRGLEKKNADEK